MNIAKNREKDNETGIDTNATNNKLVLIESEGLLFRGGKANHPIDIWDYPRGRWVRFKDAGPKKDGWGTLIDSKRADQLKSNNPHAEHFRYYDTPPWSQPLGQAWREAVLPDYFKKILAARSREPKL